MATPIIKQIKINNKVYDIKDKSALLLITDAELSNYGISVTMNGIDYVVNATIEEICAKLPNRSRFILSFTGSGLNSDNSYRFGSIGAQLPSDYCSLVIDKINTSRCNLHVTHYARPSVWEGVWTTTNDMGFTGWSLGDAPTYAYGKEDLVANSDQLTSGRLYLVYE